MQILTSGNSACDSKVKTRSLLRHNLLGSLPLAAIACALIFSAAPASAQADPPAVQDDHSIQDIIVTAERRAVSQQTTPISIAVVSGSTLSQDNVKTLQDLGNLVPGLSVTNSGSQINIRGLGSSTNSPSITTGVAVFRDGLYQPESIGATQAFYDIADVEVLKGPQGTIVGANSTGGAVQINSNNPRLTGLGGYAEIQAGNYGEKRAQGALNLPISTTLAARVAFNVRHRDSFGRDIGAPLSGSDQSIPTPGKVDERNVRVSLLWKPSERFQAVLKAENNYLDTGGFNARPLPFSSFYQYGYNGPSVYNNNTIVGPRDLVYNETALADIQKSSRYSLDMKYTLGNGITIRSLTGFQRLRQSFNADLDYSAAGTGVPGAIHTYQDVGPHDDYYSQEVNILSPSTGRLTWLAGASYFDRSTPVYNQIYNGAGAFTPIIGTSTNPAKPFTFTCPTTLGANCNLATITNTRTKQQLLGFFGQADLRLVDTLHLVVGLRESIDTNHNYGYVVTAITTPAGQAPGTTNSVAYAYIPNLGRYHKSVPTYKVALNWTPIADQFLYAFAARGYKQGGINNSASSFDPEYVNDYEVGWKGRLFDGHVLTQVGGYYMKYKGMQQPALSPSTGTSLVTNIGDSTIKGIDASFQAKLGPVRWDAGIAYNESKLGPVTTVGTYLLTANGTPAYPQCAAGSSVANGANGVVGGVQCTNYTGTLVSLSGEKNPYSPTVNFNTTLSYNIELGTRGTLTPRITYTHISSQYTSIFQNIATGTNPATGLPYPLFKLPSRSLVDLGMVYRTGDWTVDIWARNVTNRLYLSGITGNTGYLGEPRTYGVRLARTF